MPRTCRERATKWSTLRSRGATAPRRGLPRSGRYHRRRSTPSIAGGHYRRRGGTTRRGLPLRRRGHYKGGPQIWGDRLASEWALGPNEVGSDWILNEVFCRRRFESRRTLRVGVVMFLENVGDQGGL